MENSQHIKFPNIQQGFNTPIGLLGPHSRLVCNINLQDKTTRYYKTKKQVLITLQSIIEKYKKWAFNQVKYHRSRNYDHFCGEFLPGQLLRGNDKIIPQFLKRLKNQRVQSYIKFRWVDKEIPNNVVINLGNVVGRLVSKRRIQAFKKIKNYISHEKQFKIDEKISQNENMVETSVHSLSNLFFSTPQRSTARSLNVTLIKVNLTPQKPKRRPTLKQKLQPQNNPKYISVRQLEHSSQRKQYRFSSADSKWTKIRVNRSIHKI